MSYYRRSRFVFGTDDWTTEVSAHPWIPSDASVGGSRTSAAGIPASYVVRRDKLTELTLRVSEDEWEDYLALLTWGQTSATFLWYPDADEAASYTVYLESPLAGERSSPTRLGDFLRVFECTITLRNTAGVNQWQPYFADTPAGPTDTEIDVVTVTPNDVPDLPVGTSQVLIGQALNLSVQTIPGAVVTWVSSDPAVATVSGDMTSDGLVHTTNLAGLTVGSTTVTAYANGVPATAVNVNVTAAPAGTLYWDDDQTGGVFAGASGGYGWGTLSGGFFNPAPSVVADADSPTGFAVRFRFNPTVITSGSRTEARLNFGANLTEVYLGWSIKFPLNYYHRDHQGSDNNKMLRVWGNAYSTSEGDGDPGLHLGFSALPSPSTGGGSFFNFSKETQGISAGDGRIYTAWNPTGIMGVRLASDLGFYRRFVFHCKRSTAANANNGVVELWIDGVQVWSKSDADLWDYSPTAHNYFNHMYLLGAANSGFNVVTDIMVQNVAIGATYSDVA